MNKSESSISNQIDFRIKKQVQYGQAVYLCGGIAQLGTWKPQASLKLTWHEGHIWKGTLSFTRKSLNNINEIQFKFIISAWKVGSESSLQWQKGKNRLIKISMIQKHHIYRTRQIISDATWNTNKYMLFLQVEEIKPTQSFYILGSIAELGNWTQKKPMKKIETSQQDIIWKYMRFNPQFLNQNLDYQIYMLQFTTDRLVQQFSYYYMSIGDVVKSEGHPGRSVKSNGVYVEKDRIMQFQWEGVKIVFDQSSFNKLHIERITSELYIANQLNLVCDYQRLIHLKVTFLYVLNHQSQQCQDSYCLLQSICKYHNILLRIKRIEDEGDQIKKDEVKDIANEVDDLIIKGNRVCFMVTNRVLKLFPINLIQLTLVLGYSFEESLHMLTKDYEKTDKSAVRGENSLQVYEFILGKMLRGRSLHKKQ